ncbi:hypothetical protein ES703_76027 [subsurface metagenome]
MAVKLQPLADRLVVKPIEREGYQTISTLTIYTESCRIQM